MKNNSLLFALVCATLLPWTVLSQDKATLAISSVAPLPSLKTALTSAGKTLSLGRVVEAFDSQLIAAINASRKFDILGRSDLKDVIREQELGASGNVDAKTAAQAGKLTGAKYLLVTTIDDFQDSTERMEFKTLGTVGLKRKISVSAVAKIYDATTGKLLESASVSAHRKDDRTDSVDLRKDAELTDAVLLDTVKEAAGKVAGRVADVVFPVRVLAKRDQQITINRGEGAGAVVGQLWAIFAQGEELIDPDTKESLGREEVQVGKAEIISVAPKTSIAKILNDTGIEKGAVLRLAK